MGAVAAPVVDEEEAVVGEEDGPSHDPVAHPGKTTAAWTTSIRPRRASSPRPPTLGLNIDVVAFPDGTRTADDAARAVGCDVAQIVKSLVFVGGRDPGARARVRRQPARRGEAATALGVEEAGEVRRASADEVRAATGFAVGGVPPFGHGQPLRCVVDADLLDHDVVWAAAGTPMHVFAVEPGRARRRHRRARSRRGGVIKYLGSKRKLVPVLRRWPRRSGARQRARPVLGDEPGRRGVEGRRRHVTAVDTTPSRRGARPVLHRHRRGRRRRAALDRAIAELDALPAGPATSPTSSASRRGTSSPTNGARIDAIRAAIAERWAGSPLEPVLLTALLEAADRVDSTTGVQMAYLKSWAPRAHNRLHAARAGVAAGRGHGRAGRRGRAVRRTPRARRLRPRLPRPAVQPAQLPGELPRVGDDRRRRRAGALRRRLQADRHPDAPSTQRVQPAGGDRPGARRAARGVDARVVVALVQRRGVDRARRTRRHVRRRRRRHVEVRGVRRAALRRGAGSASTTRRATRSARSPGPATSSTSSSPASRRKPRRRAATAARSATPLGGIRNVR